MIVTGPRDIGQIARQRRLDLGLSQADLASRVDVTRQWLSRFEQARADVSLSKVLSILRELDLAIDVSSGEEPKQAPGSSIRMPSWNVPSVRVPTLSASTMEAMRRAVAQSLDTEHIRRSISALSESGEIDSSLRAISKMNSAALSDAARKFRARAMVPRPLESDENSGNE